MTRCIAMVGAHEATDDEKQGARQLARDLTVRKRALRKDGFTIVSGLAAGIDRRPRTGHH